MLDFLRHLAKTRPILLEERFYADLGRRIRAFRDRLQLTQQQLGSSLDPPTTRASIANIEAGKQRVLAHTLAQLATALKVPVTELLPPVAPQEDAIRKELFKKLRLPKTRLSEVVDRLTPPKPRRSG